MEEGYCTVEPLSDKPKQQANPLSYEFFQLIYSGFNLESFGHHYRSPVPLHACHVRLGRI
ncbi:hypothetical protein [Prosthecobacter sp. SYSU 5D2]|uniref:hypothetical protein n=1 Tax=Prosthecobacter sp. SYSU 5D2 TaxID=3134134 RepID=UPI0031FE7ACC